MNNSPQKLPTALIVVSLLGSTLLGTLWLRSSKNAIAFDFVYQKSLWQFTIAGGKISVDNEPQRHLELQSFQLVLRRMGKLEEEQGGLLRQKVQAISSRHFAVAFRCERELEDRVHQIFELERFAKQQGISISPKTARIGWSISMRATLVGNALVLCCGILWQLVRRYRRRRYYELGCCVECGYDLRGSADRCSECGAVRKPVGNGAEPMTQGTGVRKLAAASRLLAFL